MTADQQAAPQDHLVSALVRDEPRVLTRITSLFGSKTKTKSKAPAKISQPAGTERLRPVASIGSMRSVASEYELEDGMIARQSRTQTQYNKLSKRRSML